MNSGDMSDSRGLSRVKLKESNWLLGTHFLWQQHLPPEEEMVGEMETTDPELCKSYVEADRKKEERSVANHLTKFAGWSQAVKAAARLKSWSESLKGLQPRTNETTHPEEKEEMQKSFSSDWCKKKPSLKRLKD